MFKSNGEVVDNKDDHGALAGILQNTVVAELKSKFSYGSIMECRASPRSP